MQLQELKAAKGSNKSKRIVGRGRGSGRGGTSGRGENGQGSRAGRVTMRGYEGGQIRLIRRLAKVGFRSHRPIVYQIVKLSSLSRFKEGTVVDIEFLRSNGLIKSKRKPYKILGDGELKKALVCHAHSFSKSAQEKILKAGGKAETIKVQQPKTKEASLKK